MVETIENPVRSFRALIAAEFITDKPVSQSDFSKRQMKGTHCG
jgi:hypothetical protein